MAQQTQELAQQFIDTLHALEAGSEDEAAGLTALFSEDGTITNTALELRREEVSGSDAIQDFWVNYKRTLGQAFSNFYHVTTSDNAAGLFWTTEGHSTDGNSVTYHGATLLEFDEQGLIKFLRGYYDTRELAENSDKGSP